MASSEESEPDIPTMDFSDPEDEISVRLDKEDREDEISIPLDKEDEDEELLGEPGSSQNEAIQAGTSSAVVAKHTSII